MKHAESKSSKTRSNTDRLSHGKKIAAHKKQLKSLRAEECTFDPTARAEFLTGFHKRKVERRNKAALKNKEESRASRLAMRADLREQRKRELAQRVEAYEAALGLVDSNGGLDEGGDDDDASWSGFSDDDGTKAPAKKGIWEVNEFDEGDRTVVVQIEEM